MADPKKFVDEAGLVQLVKEIKEYHKENETEFDALTEVEVTTIFDQVGEDIPMPTEVVDGAVDLSIAAATPLVLTLAVAEEITAQSADDTRVTVSVDDVAKTITLTVDTTGTAVDGDEVAVTVKAGLYNDTVITVKVVA